MDYEALISQISHLEQQNTTEERKYALEVVKHRETQQQLTKAQDASNEIKQELERTKFNLARLQTEKETWDKVTQQLKHSIKRSKAEIDHANQEVDQEKKKAEEERKQYVERLQSITERSRPLLKYFAVQMDGDPGPAEHSNSCQIELDQKVKQLESQHESDQERISTLEKQLSAVKKALGAHIRDEQELERYVTQVEHQLREMQEAYHNYVCACGEPMREAEPQAPEAMDVDDGDQGKA